MLERLRTVMERIDELNTQFRGMGPRKARRENQTFTAALNEARKTEDTKPIAVSKSIVPISAPSPGIRTMPEYAGLIDKYSTKNNLDPKLVRRLIEAESGFDPNVISKKGAMGLMQLMPQTAEELGVINPFDPEENIAAGTKYLASMLKQNGGNMSLALAAYNAGPGTVRQYAGVPPFAETKSFISRIIKENADQSDDEEE